MLQHMINITNVVHVQNKQKGAQYRTLGDSTLNTVDLGFLTIKDNILSPTGQIAFNPF